MTAVLLALACAALWSGRPRVAHRLRAIGDRASRTLRVAPRGIAAVVGIAAATVCAGVPGALAALLLVVLIGWRLRCSAVAEQEDRRRDDLLTALSLMIAELSVGAPPARACAAAAREMCTGSDGRPPGEVATALAAMAGRAELGGAVALEAGVDSGDESWQRIAMAWSTSDSLGLPLADLLGSVRGDLLARKAFTERTRAGMAGPRATAVVLAGLPVLGIALGQATGARPIQTLAGGGLGGVLLVVGTALVVLGVVWAERIAAKVTSR